MLGQFRTICASAPSRGRDLWQNLAWSATERSMGICWGKSQRGRCESHRLASSLSPFDPRKKNRDNGRIGMYDRNSCNDCSEDHKGDRPQSFVRPYSGSLPSPGYEWCPRCNIPDKRYQKKIGSANECLDRPRLFGLGICDDAKKYYRHQMYVLTCLGIFCFGGGLFTL